MYHSLDEGRSSKSKYIMAFALGFAVVATICVFSFGTANPESLQQIIVPTSTKTVTIGSTSGKYGSGNLLLHKPSWASDVYVPHSKPANANNGRTDCLYVNNGEDNDVFISRSGVSGYWTVDMGDNYYVEYVTIKERDRSN